MELEQYLERDIITFLDSKITKKEKNIIDREEDYGLYLTKDYVKELTYALDNDELTKAKKLFDELKGNYAQLPKNSIERKKIYSLLEKMYEKIQNYVKIKEGKIEVIKEGDSEILKDNSEQVEVMIEKSLSLKKAAADRLQAEKSSGKVGRIVGSRWRDNDAKPSAPSVPVNSAKSSGIVEANILEKSIKPEKGGKYYEEKSEVEETEDISSQNIFVKSKSGKESSPENSGDNSDNTGSEIKSKDIRKHVSQHQIPIAYPVLSRESRYNPGRNSGSKENVSSEDKSLYLEKFKNEIIDKTVEQVEKLKANITTKLLEEIQQKLEQDNDLQNQRISQLKEDIIEQAVAEIKKLSSKDKISESQKVESLKREILSEVFHKAQSIITVNDNNQSDDKLMIIGAQPDDKTAKTRLQEFFENQLEPSSMIGTDERDIDKDDDSRVLLMTRQQKNARQTGQNKNAVVRDRRESNKKNNDDYDIDNFKSDMNKNINHMTKEIEEIQKKRFRHRYDANDIRRLYEEAIYTMFQSNYDDARKMFEQILEARPENRAAKIRLQECIEAIENA